MTDEQILNALKSCGDGIAICDDCPYDGRNHCSLLAKQDIIARFEGLKAENESLVREADENAALAMQHKMRVDDLEKENAALRERLDKAVELPCKVGDKVYGVGFTDCEDSRTTDEKKKRQIFNVCMKMGGNCEKCKYRRPQIEEFVCTHIQLGDCGIEGKSILIVGDRNENYTANNVFTTSEAAEARLAELKGER